MADYSQGPIGGPAPAPAPYNAPPPAAGGEHNEFLSKEQPPYPGWLKWLLIPIFVLTIAVLGMIAYCAHTLGTASESLGFNIFAAVWGIIVTIYIFLAVSPGSSLHMKWIVFILAVISCIWWLVAFAWLASNTRTMFQLIEFIDSYGDLSDIYGSYGDYSDYSDYFYNTLGRRSFPITTVASGLVKRQLSTSSILQVYQNIKTVAGVMAGAAAAGAIIWVLWLVFTFFYSVALFRTTKFTSSSTPAAAPAAPAPMYEQKTNLQPVPQQQQQYPPQPQSAYPAVPTPIASPVSSAAFTPIKPDPAYDPRNQGHFMTPPPPMSTPSPAPYANPQFGEQQQAYEMPAPVTQQQQQHGAPQYGAPHGNVAEMPAGR